MLPDAVLPVPASLMTLLAVFSPLFTAPSFRTFTALACGFLAQSGKRTVCGMLTGAALSRLWSHDRAHSFFFSSRARWNPDDLGLCAAKLVIALLVPDRGAAEALIDDTLFRRRGKRVWAASWFHDGSVAGPAKTVSPRPGPSPLPGPLRRQVIERCVAAEPGGPGHAVRQFSQFRSSSSRRRVPMTRS
jgi:hypothetical protein